MTSKFLPWYEASWAGVLRAACWCLVFLWGFGVLAPAPREDIPLQTAASGGRIIPMLTAAGDHRTLRDDYKPDARKLHIAWISDSSSFILPPGKEFATANPDEFALLPQRVAVELHRQHPGLAFDEPLYLRLGMRPLDELVFTLAALREKPDLVVIPLDQVWLFSHYVANNDTSFYLAPGLFAGHADLWYLVPLFCGPVQDLWAVVGKRFAVIRGALPLERELAQGSLLANWLRPPEAAAPSPAPEQLVPVYARLLTLNSPATENSFAPEAFREMLEALKQSGVPVLLYDSPVSDVYYGAPKTAARIRSTQDFFAQVNRGLAGSRIRLIGRIPEDVRKSIRFRDNDGYHAWETGKLDAYLAQQIWLTLNPPARH